MLTAALNKAMNGYGGKLPDIVKRQVWRYMLEPTALNWDQVHNVIVTVTSSGRFITISDALALIDPFYVGPTTSGVNRHDTGWQRDPTELPQTPDDRWPIVPNRFMVARAIDEAIRTSRR